MAMFGTSWRVGRIAGIEVRVDTSWAVIALLITYSMYLRASTLYPELSGAGAVWIGVLATVLFFGSVLVHELAHALVAQARGIRVLDITLFLFGGATRARVESRGPGDEFLIALVGPLTSGLLAALFGIIARAPLVSGPTTAIRNSSVGPRDSTLARVAPPNRNSVMSWTRIPRAWETLSLIHI